MNAPQTAPLPETPSEDTVWTLPDDPVSTRAESSSDTKTASSHIDQRAGSETAGQPQPKPDRFPEFEDAASLMKESLPPPPVVVDGLIRRGEKCVIGGASKSFKSWAALDLALSVSSDALWLGRSVTQGRVLVVNLELPRWCIRDRIDQIANARGIQGRHGDLLLWNLRDRQITDEEILATITTRKPSDLALIIIDPFYRLLNGREENSAGDIGCILSTFGRIATATGAAVVFPAHFAKGNAAGKESIDRISGSGVFAREPDSILTLTRHEAEDAFTVEATLRTFPPVAPFVVKWAHPVFSVAQSLDPKRLKQAKKPGASPKWKPEDVLQLLPASGMLKPDWQKAAKRRDIPRATFYRIAGELEHDGVVSVDKSNFVRPQPSPETRFHADE